MHREDELYFLYGYAACFDAIAFGCLAALAVRTFAVAPSTAWRIRVAAGVCLAGAYCAGIGSHVVFGFSLVALCSACLLVNAFDDLGRRAVRWPARIICWFGEHSYELYLFHIIVLAVMRELVPPRVLPPALKLPWFALLLTLSALVAGTVARYVAQPLKSSLRLRLAGRAIAAQAIAA